MSEAAPEPERRFTLDWIDAHRASVEPADLAWPDGVAIDVALDAARACKVELPWPAEGRGKWVVICKVCGFAIALETSGRADDPRTARLPCRAV